VKAVLDESVEAVMSRAKTAEPIEMPFGMLTRVGQRNHVLGRDIPTGSGNFGGLFHAHSAASAVSAAVFTAKG